MTTYPTLAGTDVDASALAAIAETRRRRHGGEFSAADLAPQFAPYLHRDVRLKVRNNRYDHVRTGTVGITTGWQPAFLLMHRSNASGSWDVLTTDDEIIAVWNGRRYEDVTSRTVQAAQ